MILRFGQSSDKIDETNGSILRMSYFMLLKLRSFGCSQLCFNLCGYNPLRTKRRIGFLIEPEFFFRFNATVWYLTREAAGESQSVKFL